MKRFIKNSNRKGFTLVETLLATFILVVTSTMLVNGFVATMGYSYQTSVYSKSGAYNYSQCMAKVANWNQLENTGAGGREVVAQSDVVDAGTGKTLEFKNATGLPSVNSLNVGVEKKDQLTGTVPDTLAGAEYAPKADNYVDNRTAIYYFPEYCQDPSDNSTLGNVIVLVDYDTTPYSYYWVYDSGSSYVSITDHTKSWNK